MLPQAAHVVVVIIKTFEVATRQRALYSPPKCIVFEQGYLRICIRDVSQVPPLIILVICDRLVCCRGIRSIKCVRYGSESAKAVILKTRC